MADTLTIRITAQDGSVAVFRKVTDGAQKMGEEIERAGEKGAKGFEKIKVSAEKVGAGIGVAVSALSLLGQAYITQQRSIDQLERQYGSASDEILQFTERIQDSTRFSNDAARASASISAGLVSQYGLSIDQIEQLISRSADLAQTSGLSLEDVVQRTSSALRGEAESAELLGLSLNDANVARYAAAQGITNYSTGLDEAGRAQVRLNLFLEQSAFATGAAGDAAGTAAGRADQFKNSIQDGAQALGGFLGPAASVAATLGQSALLLPIAGAGFGKLASGAATAGKVLAGFRVGSLAITAALGPIGLAAAAIAGGIALLDLIGVFDDTAAASGGAATGVADITTALYALQDAGAADAVLIQAQNVNEAWHAAEASLRSYNDTNQASIDEQETVLGSRLTDPDVITNQYLQDSIHRQIDELYILGDEVDAANDDVAAIFARLGDVNINGGQLATDLLDLITAYQNHDISASQFIVRLDALAQSVDENYRVLPQAASGVDLLTYSLLDGASAAQVFDEALDGINQAAERFGTSSIAGIRAYIAAMEQVRQLQFAAGNYTGAADTTALIDEANDEIDQIMAERSLSSPAASMGSAPPRRKR